MMQKLQMPQQPGWWILVTFFAMQPKSSLVLGRSSPQTLVNLTAIYISYKKPCQYVRRTLSVTDRNVQKKKCQFFLVSYCGWYVNKLGIGSQSRNYPIVILPTTRYKLSPCPFSASSENSECCSVRISGFVRCLVWRTCEQMQQHTSKCTMHWLHALSDDCMLCVHGMWRGNTTGKLTSPDFCAHKCARLPTFARLHTLSLISPRT